MSCPPWPGSITIFPIFKPSARMSDRSPAAVGRASRASAVAKSSFDFELFFFFAATLRSETIALGRAFVGARGAGDTSGRATVVSTTATVVSSASSSASTMVFGISFWGCLGMAGLALATESDCLAAFWALEIAAASIFAASLTSFRSAVSSICEPASACAERASFGSSCRSLVPPTLATARLA